MGKIAILTHIFQMLGWVETTQLVLVGQRYTTKNQDKTWKFALGQGTIIFQTFILGFGSIASSRGCTPIGWIPVKWCVSELK